MPLTYAIADLHGRFDLLKMAMSAISNRDDGTPYKVVTMGDYVDRGPRSGQIIQHLMDAKESGRPLICLKGNHEDIMLQAVNDPSKQDWWMMNGGGATLASYGNKCPDRIHLDWVQNLPLYYEDQHRVFVHAWVHPTKPLAEQIDLRCYHGEPALLWTLYHENDQGGHNGKHVVHGHHQHAHGPLRFSGRTNLDTFAWNTGRLVVGVFDDERPGGLIDTIEIKSNPL